MIFYYRTLILLTCEFCQKHNVRRMKKKQKMPLKMYTVIIILL